MEGLWECGTCGTLERHEVSDNETCLACNEHVYSTGSAGFEIGYLSDSDLSELA